MRQVAAAALTELYEPDNVSPLSIFTDRFKARFAELIYDVDELVAVQGVSACFPPRNNIESNPEKMRSNDLELLFFSCHLSCLAARLASLAAYTALSYARSGLRGEHGQHMTLPACPQPAVSEYESRLLAGRQVTSRSGSDARCRLSPGLPLAPAVTSVDTCRVSFPPCSTPYSLFEALTNLTRRAAD